MKKARWFGMLTLLAAPLGVQAAEHYAKAEAERYIQQEEVAWAESVATSDASVVRRIFADDAVWVLDGDVLNKQQAIDGAAKGPGDFVSNQLEYAHIRFFGDVAVVQGSELWTKKGDHRGRFVWIDTWLWRGGRWQIIAAEDVSVPIDP